MGVCQSSAAVTVGGVTSTHKEKQQVPSPEIVVQGPSIEQEKKRKRTPPSFCGDENLLALIDESLDSKDNSSLPNDKEVSEELELLNHVEIELYDSEKLTQLDPLTPFQFIDFFHHFFCFTQLDFIPSSSIKLVKKLNEASDLYVVYPTYLETFSQEDFGDLKKFCHYTQNFNLLFPIFLNKDECIVLFFSSSVNKVNLEVMDLLGRDLYDLFQNYPNFKKIYDFFNPNKTEQINLELPLNRKNANTYIALAYSMVRLLDNKAEISLVNTECILVLGETEDLIMSYFHKLSQQLSSQIVNDTLRFLIYDAVKKQGLFRSNPEKKVRFSENSIYYNY